MADTNFLTTRSARWSSDVPNALPQWSDREDEFHVDYAENDKVPLEYIRTLSSNGTCVEEYRSTKLDNVVAVKKMETYSDKTTIEKLNAEVAILRNLRHYHSIRIIGSYTHQDWFGILTEPVATCDLKVYLTEPSSRKVAYMDKLVGQRDLFLPQIMGCLAYGLFHNHKELKIRHRDIKPANILLKGTKVLFADFGISKTYTDTQSGTTGPSQKTPMYTSPERASNLYRNKSCDIFSLGCVFAEIFTVYKGGTYKEFLEFRRKADLRNGDGYFYKTLPAVFEWLGRLANERCDVQIIRLLRAMLCEEPKHRPDAEQVWKILTTCTSSTNTPFCRPCCMPVVCKDSTLTRQMNAEPSMEGDPAVVSGRELVPVPTDLSFNTQYREDEELALEWVRNLRHWPHALLDVVRITEEHHPLARKRIDAEGSTLATMEAEILRSVRHHHVVTLHATYQQGQVYGLLFKPAADYDLRSHMELTELRMVHNRNVPADIKFLTESFGCLASALAAVHAVGYDHGDIRPENILVHERRVFLSKFSLGLRCENTGPTGSSRLQGPSHVRDWFGRLNLGRQDEPDSLTPMARPFDSAAVQYKPPEWNDTKPELVGQPAADVFALGCVFLEIFTVLRGRRVHDLSTFLAEDEARVAYRQSLPRAFKWLEDLHDDDLESTKLLQTTIRRMLETDPRKRPTAQEVHDIMRRCKTSSGVNLCGKLCLH